MSQALLQAHIHAWPSQQPEAAHPAQRRPDELLEADQGRHRIAGQPEDRLAADHGKSQGLSRLDRHPSDQNLAESGQHGFDQIARSHRNAARGDQRVTFGQGFDNGPFQLGLIVDHRLRQGNGIKSADLDRGCDGRCIGIADLTEPGNRMDRNQFIARGHDRYARPGVDRHPGMSERGQQTDLGRSQHGTLFQNGFAGSDVLADRADILAGTDCGKQTDPAVGFRGLLEGDHGIGAGGNRGTRHDPHGRSFLDGQIQPEAGILFSCDEAFTSGVGAEDPISVHRRGREGGNILLGDDILRQHQAGHALQRLLNRRERRQGPGNPAPGIFKGEHRVVATSFRSLFCSHHNPVEPFMNGIPDGFV